MRTVVVTIAAVVTFGMVAARNGSLTAFHAATPAASSDQGNSALAAAPAHRSPIRVVDEAAVTTGVSSPEPSVSTYAVQASSAPVAAAPQRVAQNNAGPSLATATATGASGAPGGTNADAPTSMVAGIRRCPTMPMPTSFRSSAVRCR